jgi:hypothetical protein
MRTPCDGMKWCTGNKNRVAPVKTVVAKNAAVVRICCTDLLCSVCLRDGRHFVERPHTGTPQPPPTLASSGCWLRRRRFTAPEKSQQLLIDLVL